MLDLRNVLSRLEEVAARLATRGDAVQPGLFEELRELDAGRRARISEVEALKKQRNEASPKIGAMIKSGENADALRADVRRMGEAISSLDEEIHALEERLSAALLELPNLPHESCPVGSDEEANRVERVWGERPGFSFDARDHVEIGEISGVLDLERASKITGARFAVLTGLGARVARALTDFMLDLHTHVHGYEEVQPPFIANRESLVATGQLPKFEADLFRLADHDGWYLVPTAEVPLTNLHRDEIVPESRLPIRYTAYTPCFRSEAGSHGRDVRGLIRQHQFDKVELVAFAHPEASWDALEELTGHAEEVLRRLGLHHRVVTLATGDLGFASAKTYDIEVWLPSQGRFREISSCSNYADFQARRGSIRFRPDGGGKTRFVHTLNGSGLAVGRTLVAIMEQFQRENGTFDVPEVLEPYMRSRLG